MEIKIEDVGTNFNYTFSWWYTYNSLDSPGA